MNVLTGLFRFIFFLFSLMLVFVVASFFLVVGVIVYLVRGGRRPQVRMQTQWPPRGFGPEMDLRMDSQLHREPRQEKDVTPRRERDVTPIDPAMLS